MAAGGFLTPAEAYGVVCRHFRRRRSKRLRLCAACARQYRARENSAEFRRTQRRRAKARAARWRARLLAARAARADRTRWAARHRRLYRTYGLTIFQFNWMLRRQRGACKICRRPSPMLYPDHDHATGRVRGLLCYRCNRGLAFFRDSAGALGRAADYVLSAFDGRAIPAQRVTPRVLAQLDALAQGRAS